MQDPIAHEVRMEEWKNDNRIKAAGIVLCAAIAFTVWQKVDEALGKPGPFDVMRETYGSMVKMIGSKE
jgi:hypothetical protein